MITKYKVFKVRNKLDFTGSFVVDSMGLNEGVAMFWRDVDSVKAEGFGRWRLSSFYGYPRWNRCRESWQLMCSLLDKSTLPWIILGDFNDLLYASEKEIKHFRYENAWSCELDCKQVIKESWAVAMPVPIAGRMEDCGKKLQQWASSFHKDFKDRLEDCRRRLALLRQNYKNPNHLDLKEVEEHYAQFLLQ
uniref:Endonuclease/exonuclease/phosphatase domain-containing protein n=1 Tax=Manihot esculenta TaxID=3983 RepID=A0A199U9N3_MANES